MAVLPKKCKVIFILEKRRSLRWPRYESHLAKEKNLCKEEDAWKS